jgi:hypothetical protein
MKIHNEKGIALPLVMIAIMVGALVIPAFLGRVSTGLLGSRGYKNVLDAQYTADAGAEHAIWNLTGGTVKAAIPAPGDSTSYVLQETLNGVSAGVKISNAWEVIARDNFNAGTWTGGTGWLGDWEYSGDALAASAGLPFEGAYHLRLRNSDGVVSRAVDLGQEVSANLVFWAKMSSAESGDAVICRISHDGSNWTTVYTWDDSFSDDTYHYYDIDLTPQGLTDVFYVSFQSNMNSTEDYFYVDDLQVIWPANSPKSVAADDFESGGWAGGDGWLGDWTNTGTSGVVTSGIPHGGNYHLLLQDVDGYTVRAADLSGVSAAHLKFWAKVNDFELGDTASCLISTDGLSWQTVATWTSSNDDNTYHLYDFDITGYGLTGEVRVAFEAGMDAADDYFYVDDISIDVVNAYCITVTAGDRTLKAAVDLMGGVPTVLCWWFLV